MQELLNFVFAAALVGLYLVNRGLRREVDELRQYTAHLLRQGRKVDEPALPTPKPADSPEMAPKSASAAPSVEKPPASVPPMKPAQGFPSLDQLVAATSAPRPNPAHDPDFLRTNRKKSNAEWEQFIGGNLFSKLGVLALVIAGGLFLSYAFENDLVSETMRCVIGFLIGGLSLGLAHWSHQKKLPVFSQALVALGVSVWYLTVYAMSQFYSLVPDGVATALTLVVCLITAGLALYYRSEPVAIMAALGAYLTPVLLGDPSATAIPLLAYLLFVALAVSALVWLRAEWVWLRPVPVVGTLVLTAFWYADNSVNSLAAEAVLCYLLWLLFLGYDILHRVLDPKRSNATDLIAASLNGLYAVVITIFLTEAASEFWQALCSASIAAVYAALAFSTHDRLEPESKPVMQVWLGAFAVLAMGAVFAVEDEYPGVALTAAVAMGFFFAARSAKLKTVNPAMGMFLIIASFALFIMGDDLPEPDWFLANTRTLAYALVAMAWLVAGLTAPWTDGKRYLLSRSVAGIAAVVLGFLWLNFEMDAAFDRWMPYDYEIAESRENWIELTRSALWMLYSLMLFAIGVLRSSVAARYASIVLFGVTILKIFLSDLSFLDTPYRIASFMVLGLILLLVSFVYQRYRHVIFGTAAVAETNLS